MSEVICKYGKECLMFMALTGDIFMPCGHAKPHAPGRRCTRPCLPKYHYQGDCIPVEKEEHLDM